MRKRNETGPRDKGIVIRAKAKLPAGTDVFWEYWIVREPLKARMVGKEDADKYIASRGLVETLRNEYGMIYDTPDKAFQRRWKGFNKDPRDRRKFLDFWRDA